jgi:hypothetical protein
LACQVLIASGLIARIGIGPKGGSRSSRRIRSYRSWVRILIGRSASQVAAYSPNVWSEVGWMTPRWSGGVHSPATIRRRSSTSQASASSLVSKVIGAVWRLRSGPRYRAR